MSGAFSPYDRIRWMEFRNRSGETIPPFGIVRMTGVDSSGIGRLELMAEKPDAFGSQWSHFVNSHLPVKADGYGRCAVPEGPVLVAYASESTPEAGQSWGPMAGSWTLHPHVGGFRIIGGASEGRVLAVRQPLLDLRVTLDEPLASGGTADATPSYWNGSGWIDFDATITVREMMGLDTDMAAGSIGTAHWIPEAGFCLIAAGC